MKFHKMAVGTAALLLLACSAYAQMGAIEGDVKGQDGKPLAGAQILITRTDMKASYKVKTDKKGHWVYSGLPALGKFDIAVEVDGKAASTITGVKATVGEPTNAGVIDLSKVQAGAPDAAAAAAAAAAADAGRRMSPEERAKMEKENKAREEALKKNKELNDAFNAGMAAEEAKQWDQAIASYEKGTTVDPKQTTVWVHLADCYFNLSATQTGADADATAQKGLDAYGKAIELKPEDPNIHNNFGLALAKAKKFPEAEAELAKAVQLDPPHAGQYYYNLGALLANRNQNEAAGQAFKKAIDADPNYADAQYFYGTVLMAQAKFGADGSITAVPGTQEAFQKYLQLKPDGPHAAEAKAMLESLGSKIDTSYKNPNSKSTPTPAPKKK